ncbi:hypothetical protein FXW78_34370 [Rhodococcus opacus]|nr:hypothetical protein [Rhodococcus opacus]
MRHVLVETVLVTAVAVKSARDNRREGRPPVTDGPFAETKDVIAGWMVIDVETHERALELAGELSAAPGADGKPIHEWLEVRPFLTAAPNTTECGFHQGR